MLHKYYYYCSIFHNIRVQKREFHVVLFVKHTHLLNQGEYLLFYLLICFKSVFPVTVRPVTAYFVTGETHCVTGQTYDLLICQSHTIHMVYVHIFSMTQTFKSYTNVFMFAGIHPQCIRHFITLSIIFRNRMDLFRYRTEVFSVVHENN